MPLAKNENSIADSVTIRVSVWLSLGYHLFLLVLFAGRASTGLIEFWAFMFCDILLCSFALIPLVAVVRRRLVWFDPFSVLSFIFFGMVGMFFPAYIQDPIFVSYFSSHGGYPLSYLSEPAFLVLAVKAELILGAFWSIMLLTNHRRLSPGQTRCTRGECRVSLLTTALCAIAGTVGFLSYWTLDSFMYAITAGLGSIMVKSPSWGTSRFLLLVRMATTSFSLGLVGWVGLRKAPMQQPAGRFILLGSLVAAFLNLWNGARGEVLFAFIIMFVIAGQFGFKIRKDKWLFMGGLVVAIVSVVTVLRQGSYRTYDPTEVVTQVVSRNAFREYSLGEGFPSGTLLALDRISVMTMVLYYLDTIGSYLHGESLLASPVNTAADWISRMSGSGRLEQGVLREANQVITLWRRGSPAHEGVPPSFPGEFYLQAGVLSLLLLSFLFGRAFWWLRKKIAGTESLIGRWFLTIISLHITLAFSAEVSVLTPVLLYLILPVLIVYWITKIMLGIRVR